jgi:hypothetical protein
MSGPANRFAAGSLRPQGGAKRETEKWGIFRLVLHGPSAGNLFRAVRLSAAFRTRTGS